MEINDVFEDLFVLEVTNNHRGDVIRGLEIIKIYADIIRTNDIKKAAIKFQFRNLDNFIHKDYKSRHDIRYIRRITETQISKSDYLKLMNAVRENGCIPMATPFDEDTISWCVEFDLPIIKVASVDSNDRFLLKKIAETNRPVIISTGGTSVTDLDEVVNFFEKRGIPLALNHCIAAYPTEDNELELNQIDFLKNRYPNHIIGLSSHEHLDWSSSMMIAYAKGARLFERHVDIGLEAEISAYSSLPEQINTWFSAYKKAKEMCGSSSEHRKTLSSREKDYLDSHCRGIYAKRDLSKGQILREEDIYLAIPVQKGQLSTREFFFGNTQLVLLENCAEDHPITFEMLHTTFPCNVDFQDYVRNRGV